MTHPRHFNQIDACVDAILAHVPGDIILGIPLGIGKPNPLVNALYRRVRADTTRRMVIVTALSLEKPVGKSELEQHFLAPLVERVFEDYPDLEYVKALRHGELPPNIEVREFFLKTGDYLGNDTAQQNYISTNYTFVARDMAVQGINVLAQAVAAEGEGDDLKLSLSSNTDLTKELIERMRAEGAPLLTVAVINRKMPFMPNNAVIEPAMWDFILTDPAATHTLFAPPNGKVSTADYAIGLHAASLVADGGTLQIGIGALGDAIAQALIVRDRHGDDFRTILDSLCPQGLAGRELGRFEQGLYGCSEMFVNGFLKLIDAGIIRRRVYADAALQHLINQGRIGEQVTPATLTALLHEGRIHRHLSERDVEFLVHFGILREGTRLVGPSLVCGDATAANDLADDHALAVIQASMLGTGLRHGIHMTGGFFLGPGDFYQRLRTMPPDELARIDMTRIDFINQLYGDDALKRAQRVKARFMNTTMMVTLMGAAVSDGLDTGQVVSGVGGQYNFVAMSHALPDARLIMMLRATHDHKKDGLKSSIVWNYGHITIPRHLRDVVVTEYGVAELRGQSDSEVIKRLLAIADSRFQPQLLAEAKAAGKLAADYEIPATQRNNLPQRLDDALHPWSKAGRLPDFPFGTDLTADELHIVRALKRLKRATEHPTELVAMAVKSLWEDKEAPREYLERLGLADAKSFRDMFVRKLFAGNL